MSEVSDKEILSQLPFDFTRHTAWGRNDFMVTECNKNAFSMIENWPDWFAQGLVIYGPKGCGKSHLAHVFADKVKQSAAKPVKILTINAKNIHLRSVKRIAMENQHIIIENLVPNADNEALFHIFNIFNTEGRYMLWTAETAPSRMRFGLKDFQSRINMLPSIEIKYPDDVMLQTLIVKLFNDRQIMISPEILEYIIMNARRSFSYIQDLVAQIDDVSLAYQSAVTYDIVKKAMDILEEKEKRQLDLFEEY